MVIIVLVTALQSFPVRAQQLGYNAKQTETTNKKKPENRWSMGITAGPQFTDISNVGSASSVGKTGFLAGFFFQYNVIKNLGISTGLNYDRRSFGLQFYTPFIVFPDTISYKSYSVIDMKYDVDFLTIPLNIVYTVGEGKLRFYLKGTFYYSLYIGAYKKGYTNIFIHPDDYQYLDPETEPDIQPGDNRVDYKGKTTYFLGEEKFSNFDVGIVFSLGLSYQLSERLYLNLSPGFHSSFGRLLNNPGFSSIKWIRNISIETGLTYKLKK